MLGGLMYNDDVAVKYVSGDKYKGFTTTDDSIKGAIIGRTSRKLNGDGTVTSTSNVLNTNVLLPITTLIVYESRDREIVDFQPVHNHLMGGLDHYEYKF